jgi:hypothetical protein
MIHAPEQLLYLLRVVVPWQKQSVSYILLIEEHYGCGLIHACTDMLLILRIHVPQFLLVQMGHHPPYNLEGGRLCSHK